MHSFRLTAHTNHAQETTALTARQEARFLARAHELGAIADQLDSRLAAVNAAHAALLQERDAALAAARREDLARAAREQAARERLEPVQRIQSSSCSYNFHAVKVSGAGQHLLLDEDDKR